jgi:hypothetical protein
MNAIIEKIYKPDDDFMFSYTIPFIFIIVMVFIIIRLYARASILESKQSWENSMCIPKYMFVSGLIHKPKGENILESTFDNFEKCVSTFKINPK